MLSVEVWRCSKSKGRSVFQQLPPSKYTVTLVDRNENVIQTKSSDFAMPQLPGNAVFQKTKEPKNERRRHACVMHATTHVVDQSGLRIQLLKIFRDVDTPASKVVFKNGVEKVFAQHGTISDASTGIFTSG